MKLIVEIEREDDGRWLAEIGELPGVLAYGVSEAEATAKAQALTLRVIADRLEHGEFSQLSSESVGDQTRSRHFTQSSQQAGFTQLRFRISRQRRNRAKDAGPYFKTHRPGA